MKVFVVLAMMSFSLAFGVCLTDVKIQVPWSGERSEAWWFTSECSESDAKHLRDLARAGVFEALRKEFFPELDASMEAADDQPIWIAVKKADLYDVIIYCHMCRIYAELLKTKDSSYMQQLGDEERVRFLKRLKTELYNIYNVARWGASGTGELGEAEEFPPIVVIQDEPIQNEQYCEAFYLAYLFVADIWRADSTARGEPLYRCFYVPTMPSEVILPIRYELFKEQYEIFKEINKERRKLDFHQFVFESCLLDSSSETAQYFTMHGCYYEDRPVRYNLEEIHKKQKEIDDEAKIRRTKCR